MVSDTASGCQTRRPGGRRELARGKVNAIDVELLEAARGHPRAPGARRRRRALVLTGAGPGLLGRGGPAPRGRRRTASTPSVSWPGCGSRLEALFCFPKPTVAAVNGAAVAGGCILACACDRRLMADGARIGASELAVGVPFPVAALEILRHACGSRTEDLVYRGRLLDADEALALGMVHEVCPAEDVLERAMAVAAELGGRAPVAYRLAKEQLRRPALERMRRDGAASSTTTVVARVGRAAHRGAPAPATRPAVGGPMTSGGHDRHAE